jgi:hypothetical protein
MIPFLEDTMRLATNLELRRWATETLVQMREFIAQRDRIEAENRRQQEAYEKKYSKPKKK